MEQSTTNTPHAIYIKRAETFNKVNSASFSSKKQIYLLSFQRKLRLNEMHESKVAKCWRGGLGGES